MTRDLALSFLRLLATAHDGALAAPVLRGLDAALATRALELLDAPSAKDAAQCLASCEALLGVFACVLARASPTFSRADVDAARLSRVSPTL